MFSVVIRSSLLEESPIDKWLRPDRREEECEGQTDSEKPELVQVPLHGEDVALD